MISNSSIPPVEFVNEKNEQCDLTYATCIKVNVVNLSTIISAVRAQQYKKNLYNQFIENADELDYLVDIILSSNQDPNVNIEELKKISRERIINSFKKDISIMVPRDRDADPRDSEFLILSPTQIRNILNPHLNSIIQAPYSKLVIVNIGLENFKDQEKARFFIDAFSQFSKEYQEPILINLVC